MSINLKKALTNLGVLVLLAMVVGSVVGYAMGESATLFDPLGRIFIQLIKMLVIPLVSISILSGAMSLGATKKAGKVAVITLSFIFITSIIAGLLAVAMGTWFQPGSGVSPEIVEQFVGGASAEQTVVPALGFWQTIESFIPTNPFAALVDGNILQIIVFCMLLGFGIGTVSNDKKDVISKFIDGVLDALIWCIKVVMWTAPVGVFALMASAVGTLGFDIFAKLANLLWVNIVALLILWFGLYLVLIHFFSNISVAQFLKAMIKPQAVALSTASSLATLSINMEVAEEELKLSKATTSFVLPLGATINMTGNVIYYVLATLFFAQFYGIDLSLGAYVAVIITATLSAVGQAGVPGPTLTLFAVLIAGGIPLDGVPLLFAIDRLFDMIRTTINITGDVCAAAIVDKYA
ncbi:MAG: dicarboxylate/amino acid:cation symporter [Bacteroidales bacterium]|jgi:Na+/H+-dicarboxylate symporter|nr:dicarboxylate/amino acid:cation symporter [Bacteroidales bacterium]